MHQDHAGAGLGDDAEHRGIVAGRDVVHDRRPGLDGGPRDVGLARVHRDGNVGELVDDPADHRHDAADLLIGRHDLRARPGGLAADVEQIGAVDHHLARVLHRVVDIGVHATVRERVRRDVHDPHDQGANAERQ